VIIGAVIGWCLPELLGGLIYMGTAVVILAILIGVVWLLVWLLLH
jgi:hypothetical protein